MNGDIDANGDVDEVVLAVEEQLRDSLTEVSGLAAAGAQAASGSEIEVRSGASFLPGAQAPLTDHGESVAAAAGSSAPVHQEDECAAREARLVSALDLDSTVDLVEQLGAITRELARTAKQPRPFPVRGH